jgi:CRP-like cAMP-binding protein
MERQQHPAHLPKLIEEALPDDAIPRLTDRLLAETTLFAGIPRPALVALLRQVGHLRQLAAGEDLITEGEAADAIYFVESGAFEVRKRSEATGATRPCEDEHRIGQALPGAVVGEVALLDRGTRSATVRALEPSVALRLRVRDLEEAATAEVDPAVQMQLNLGRDLAHKIRHSTAGVVRHLESALHEEQKRAEMGRFMNRVLIGTCLYMFALVLLQPLKALVPDSAVFSVLILLGFAFGLWLIIRTSIYPASAYGFTLVGWRPALREALLFSVPLLVLTVALKAVLLQTSSAFAGLSMFDLYRQAGLGPAGTLAVVGAYVLFVPIQEMVARSGIQSSLMMYLRPRHRVPMSIFMSTLLFSATHLHTNIEFALVVFPFGLFWAWLYSRHPTLVGVVASHLLIGVWAIFVVSFPFL